MIASTLSRTRWRTSRPRWHTPGWFQLYPPDDPEIAESLVQRAEAAGSRDRDHSRHRHPGLAPARPLDGQLPPARGGAWPTTSRPGLPQPARGPARGGPGGGDRPWAWSSATSLGWDDLAWLRSLTTCRSCSRGSATPTRAARSMRASTGSTVPTTVAARRTAVCRDGLSGRGARPANTYRSSSTPASAAGRTSQGARHRRLRRWPSAGRTPSGSRSAVDWHRARAPQPPRGDGPADGGRRLPEHRRPHPGGGSSRPGRVKRGRPWRRAVDERRRGPPVGSHAAAVSAPSRWVTAYAATATTTSRSGTSVSTSNGEPVRPRTCWAGGRPGSRCRSRAREGWRRHEERPCGRQDVAAQATDVAGRNLEGSLQVGAR